MTQQKSLLILDCDGTLYKAGNIPLPMMKRALYQTMKTFGITPEAYEKASAETRVTHPGLMNFLLKVSENNMINFARFSETMVKNLDYKQILPNPNLLSAIQKMAEKMPVCIFTNNCKKHLDNVLMSLFNKDTKKIGIPCFSIEDTFDGHWFNPKQSEKGLAIICKKMNVDPQNAVLIDDTLPILNQARAQGLQTRLVTYKRPLVNHLHEMHAERSRV